MEEEGVDLWSPTGTESPEEVCADWEEEEPVETLAAAASGCNVDCVSLGAVEPKGSDGVGPESSMVKGAVEAARHFTARGVCRVLCRLVVTG